MRWLEIIEYSSPDRKFKFIEKDLKKIIEELDNETDHLKIKIFSRVSEEIYFSIHLHQNSKSIGSRGSELGARLSSKLKKFGFVNHSIWV